MEERRGYWFLLTGLLIGLLLGSLYSMVIAPLQQVDMAPISLSAADKDRYRGMVVAAYTANPDVSRARARLALLNDPDPAAALMTQANNLLAQGGSASEARNFAMLASAISSINAGTPLPLAAATPTLMVTPDTGGNAAGTAPVQPTVTAPSAPTKAPTRAASATVKAVATVTLAAGVPTATPTATPGAPFGLKNREQVCDATLGALLQVQITDASGNPVPGVEVRVTWVGGEDAFFTGLKPDKGTGYADFTMNPDETYTLRLTDGGRPVTELKAPRCTDADGKTFAGGWLLSFSQ
ncbi:MAG TPA: hypothetical protein PKW33_12860 [Anaerolineaceae bacterium]|nr:hypothetical protein [Anaerolineaceae bacterium]HPN52473.1 hypothetical protein [Anaerolineaceae bacterium]